MRNLLALVAVSSLFFACSAPPVEEVDADPIAVVDTSERADMTEPEAVEDMLLPPGDVARWGRDFSPAPDIAGCRVATARCVHAYECCGGAADCVSVGAERVCCIHAGGRNWIDPGPPGVAQKNPALWCCPGTRYNAIDRSCD